MKNTIAIGYMFSILISGCAQKPANTHVQPSGTVNSTVAANLPPAIDTKSIVESPSVPTDNEIAETLSVASSSPQEASSANLPNEPATQAAALLATESPTKETTGEPQTTAEIAESPTPPDAVELPADPKPVAAKSAGKPIDLTEYYRTHAREFPKMTGYPWRDVPSGVQTLGNVPLAIDGMICLWGGNNAARGLVFPEHVADIKIGRKFDALYLYHATFHVSPEETPVLNLVFVYPDDTSANNEICYGTHVRDWYQAVEGPEELTDPKSKMVWSGVNSMSTTVPPRKLQFFITEIANPFPEVEVVSIDLVSLKSKSASCILAMTTGPAGLLKVEPKAAEEKKE